MKINREKITAIIIIILMASVIATTTKMTVKALSQPVAGPLPAGVTASITVTPTAYLDVTPNPIGVGQELLVNIWLQPPININRDLVNAFTVTITKPDGTTTTVGPISSYAGDSTAWFPYTPDTAGIYKFQFNFLGQYYPAGYYLQGSVVENGTSGSAFLDSAYYKPATTPQVSVTVQQDAVASWPPAALPTDYWSRPAESFNREWWPILGNWPPTGVVGGSTNWPANTNKYMSNYRFTPYVQAPNTAHIVWQRPTFIAGLIGGPAEQLSWTAGGLTGSGYPTIIYSGRCYEVISEPTQPVYINGTWQYPTTVNAVNEWRCYDLQTGKIYWERPVATGETIPTIITYERGGAEVPGAEARVGESVYFVAITGASGSNSGRVIKYDPLTGTVVSNFTGVPSGVSTGTFYADPWVLSIQTIGSGSSAAYRLINWTIANNAGSEQVHGGGAQTVVDNFTARIWGNISWPFSSLGTVDYESGIAVTTGAISSAGLGVNVGIFIQAANIYTGQLLWNKTTDTSSGWGQTFGTPMVVDHGKAAVRLLGGDWDCWDLKTGNLVWTSPLSEWPWGVFGAYDVQSAYGYIFDNDYAGVHAINWITGKIEWTFTAPAPPFETPYGGNYSWHSSGYVADGKLFTFNCEHTPSEPITRGWRLFCINATTGAGIWNITMGQGVPGSRYFEGAISDGYLAFLDEYDGYLDVFGKGLTQTTVTAPDTATPLGTQVLIRGTVMDQSPAQPGTPCVSADSMSTQMEYLHMQIPIDGMYHNVTMTGIPVTLTAIDSSGKVINIGVVTSSAYYGTFEMAWTPPTEGTYKIVASFAGDDSYGSSGAATAIAVSPAATLAPSQAASQSVTPDYTMTIVAGVIAIIIVVILSVATAILILRKR
ncbi:MAG: hypothetical protein ACXV2C_00985 [Candidatus Bathyarchaeia archaeon]